MTQDTIQTPLADKGFQDRWAAWQAQGAASDRAIRRKFIVIGILLVLGAVAMNGLWLIR